MRSRTRWLAWVGGIWLLSFPASGLQAAASSDVDARHRLRNHFDSDAVLGSPGFFDFLVLASPGRAVWKVTVGNNPPSAPNVATQTVTDRPEGSIAAAMRRNAQLKDGALAVALQKGSGRGGLVFRLADEKTFCALLVNLVNGEALLTKWRNGRAEPLARGQAELASEWGVLAVGLDGSRIEAKWSGKPLLQAADPLPVAGRAGMAAEGPGAVSFDEFLLEWTGPQ